MTSVVDANDNISVISNFTTLSDGDETTTTIATTGHKFPTDGSAVYVMDQAWGWLPATVVSCNEEQQEATVSVLPFPDEASVQSALRRRPPPSRSPLGGGGETNARRAYPPPLPPAGGSREVTVKLSDYSDQSLPLQNIDGDGKLHEVDDIVDLPHLHEPAILFNLKARHVRCLPYTRTGEIIIAVNPYQWIPGLYSDEMRDFYAEKLIWEVTGKKGDDATTATGKKGDDATTATALTTGSLVDPHAYEISSLAYHDLIVDGRNQSILVSGESGAGKTETVKILIHHLASIQIKHEEEGGEATDDDVSRASVKSIKEKQALFLSRIGTDRKSGTGTSSANPVVERVLDSNPLLEAFGNAMTVRNDNSSRFGKYIQLQFDTSTVATTNASPVALAGSKCLVYLLEKSRIVGHAPGERNYHIFYELLAAPTEFQRRVGLLREEEEEVPFFNYVGEVDSSIRIEKKSDAERWHETVKSLDLVGIKGETLDTVMQALVIILQLGNLVFVPKDKEHEDEGCLVPPGPDLKRAATLLGIPEKDLVKGLTTKTFVSPNNEIYHMPQTCAKAKYTCDAFSKEIYSALFAWLVEQTNEATGAAEAAHRKMGTIGLLDIFGFESLGVNRLEQLCINYANEKLQQEFTMDIFRSIKGKDLFDCPEWYNSDEMAFTDNVEVLNLLEGPMGVLAVLDEECVRPQGNDVSFVAKIFDAFENSKEVTEVVILEGVEEDLEGDDDDDNEEKKEQSPSLPSQQQQQSESQKQQQQADCLFREPLFEKVAFGVQHYAGPITYDATNFVATNRDRLSTDVIDLCARQSTNDIVKIQVGTAAAAAASLAKSRSPDGPERTLKTLATKFRRQLTDLMATIGETRTRYIRCINPNTKKMPMVMEHHSTMEQLRFAGVVAAVTITRFASPDRFVKIPKRKSTRRRSAEQRELEEETRRLLLEEERKKQREEEEEKRKEEEEARRKEEEEAARKAANEKAAAARSTGNVAAFRSQWESKVKKAASISELEAVKPRKPPPPPRSSSSVANEAVKKEKQRIVVYRDEGVLEDDTPEEAKSWGDGLTTASSSPSSMPAMSAPLPTRGSSLPANTTSTPVTAPGHLSTQQKVLMDEVGKMLESLRKEVSDLRGENNRLRSDFSNLQDTSKRLMEANKSAGESFEALNQHARQLTKSNTKLQSEVSTVREQLQKASEAHMEAKEELKMKQATYMAEVHSRKRCEKMLAAVVDKVEDQCRDGDLVEEILAMTEDDDGRRRREEEEMAAGEEQQEKPASPLAKRRNAGGRTRPTSGNSGGLTSRITSLFYDARSVSSKSLSSAEDDVGHYDDASEGQEEW